ncbi:MAG TPA: MBL fold metallo-hydrolase [Candidatus Limnocylindria bacterium]|nr:MBL fold metallo-hydrolase [Candidatus Limnocylindria bacterium]
MTLEDSIGDILSKARTSLQVSVDEAATAAGLSPAAYAELEKTGRPLPTDWNRLGAKLTLDGAKLSKIAQGWLPPAIDLSNWREIRAFSSTEDGITVNCYLIWDEVTREAALFDTGFDAAPILACIAENDLQLKHFFLTHSHPDHLAALPAIRAQFPKLRLHSNSKNAPVDARNRANDFIMLGSLRITNRETPGHSDDGVTYVVGNWPEDATHVAIVGDAIFAGSMGGARDQLELARKKVREQIFSLPSETLLCCGHGPLTTIAAEKANNPWFP